MEVEQGDKPLCQRIVELVADELGVVPLKLPPLYETIDPDKLEDRFAPAPPQQPRFGQVTFTYAGFEIEVAYDGEIVITADERSPASGQHQPIITVDGSTITCAGCQVPLRVEQWNPATMAKTEDGWCLLEFCSDTCHQEWETK